MGSERGTPRRNRAPCRRMNVAEPSITGVHDRRHRKQKSGFEALRKGQLVGLRLRGTDRGQAEAEAWGRKMTWSYCTAFAGGVAVRKCLRAAAAHRWYLLFNKSTTTTLPLNVNFFHISSNQEARLIAMERLPAYVEDQVPQNAFDALLTRIISSPAILRLPDARIILETYVEGQRRHHTIYTMQQTSRHLGLSRNIQLIRILACLYQTPL